MSDYESDDYGYGDYESGDYSYGDYYGHHYDETGYDSDGHAFRQFGRDCERARLRLASSKEGDSIDIDLGADCQSNYGQVTIQSVPRQFYRFCNAMEELPDDRVIESVRLHHFNMSRFEGIEAAFRGKRINSLSIESCFGWRSTEFLSKFLEGDRTLERLRVDCGLLTPRFSNAIREHPTLEGVDLRNSDFKGEQDFIEVLQAVKDKSEVSIRSDFLFSMANEKWKGVHLIPGVLATNPLLEKLRLEGGDLCYNTFFGFAQALSSNTNLTSLTLDEINEKAKAILLKVIFDDRTLNSVAASNHRCRIWLDGGGRTPLNEINDGLRWIQGGGDGGVIAKQSKLLCAAGAFDEESINVRRLTGFPIALAPRVIEFVQSSSMCERVARNRSCVRKIADDPNKLASLVFKNVFELMRNIVAPLLPAQNDSHGLKRKRDD